MTTTTRAAQFEAFADKHGYVVETALTCYVEDMRDRAQKLHHHYASIKDDPAKREEQDRTLVTTEALRATADSMDEAADRGQEALDAWTEIAEAEL